MCRSNSSDQLTQASGPVNVGTDEHLCATLEASRPARIMDHDAEDGRACVAVRRSNPRLDDVHPGMAVRLFVEVDSASRLVKPLVSVCPASICMVVSFAKEDMLSRAQVHQPSGHTTRVDLQSRNRQVAAETNDGLQARRSSRIGPGGGALGRPTVLSALVVLLGVLA